MANSPYRINGNIRGVREVRLIDDSNTNIGVVNIQYAQGRADDVGLDLVEVAPNAEPPVCRIMDYGKFQYEQRRKERKSKKNQVKVTVKEIQLRPKTDEYHLRFDIKRAEKWLLEGKKVKFRVRFRGREITHQHIGRDRLGRIEDELKDVGVVEQRPNMEGRDMLMILAPIKDNRQGSEKQ
ncbi:MAG: translation initiation factor IF-3 [Chloroflexota bacterium]|nr:translation initiation factor IF-3 [Chloroflexota bacterium]MDE2948672.1 translation initiation factor IF-3 [Chloroflexota bacterium]